MKLFCRKVTRWGSVSRGFAYALPAFSPAYFSAKAMSVQHLHAGGTQLRVLVPVSNGSEDIEVACVVDVLRRAHMHVDVATVDAPGAGGELAPVVLARGLRLMPDMGIADCVTQTYDCIALPGGMPGAKHLQCSAPLTTLLRAQRARKGWLAAICASPAVVLVGTPGLLPPGTRLTGHAAFDDQLGAAGGNSSRVVVDQAARVITSKGPGTALEWSLAIVALLAGPARAAEVAKPMHMHREDVIESFEGLPSSPPSVGSS